MKINIKKTLCIFGILLTTPFFTLYAYKTKSITIGGAEWSNDATLKQVFINQSLNVQLTPQIEKILTVDTEVVWDFVSDEDGSIVSTGSTGKVLVFNQQNQLQHELSLDEAEITVIAKSSEQVYFGSGPAGKIFRIAKNKLTSTKTLDSSSKPWLETQEQFVWDIKLNQNELWVATGGEQGKIFRISPSATAMPIPTVVVAEPNITKLMIKKQGGKTYLYFGTSTQGKFYRLDITGLPQNATPEMIGANLTLLFDAGEKDIADFIFINDDIYVVTSGSGAIGKGTVVGAGESATSKINEGGLIEISEKNGNTGEAEGAQGDVSAESFIADFGGTGGGENYLVHINSANNVSFLYRFENKSPMRIGYLAKTKQLYIGILEDAEIYVMPVQKDTLSRVEKIFSKPEATFSDLFVFNDQLYFTIANLGEIYQLQERLPTQGVYVSRVFDFQETVKWGALKWENHNPGTAVEVWTRSGNSQKPVTINFISGIDLIETNNLSTNESENEGNAPPPYLPQPLKTTGVIGNPYQTTEKFLLTMLVFCNLHWY